MRCQLKKSKDATSVAILGHPGFDPGVFLLWRGCFLGWGEGLGCDDASLRAGGETRSGVVARALGVVRGGLRATRALARGVAILGRVPKMYRYMK